MLRASMCRNVRFYLPRERFSPLAESELSPGSWMSDWCLQEQPFRANVSAVTSSIGRFTLHTRRSPCSRYNFCL
jgi:hypothetical protein